MTDEIPEPLTAAEAAEVDALYRPFPSFGEWPNEVPQADIWDSDLGEFQHVSAAARDEDLRRAQEVALRAAAFDSGAIEGLYPTDRGLTFTVATQAAAWQQQVDERSEDARSLFEGQLAAFELVLDLVTERFPSMTQAWIRRLHEEITAAQDTYVVQTPAGSQAQPLPKGKYKDHPNHVRTRDGRVHAYAPVEQTQAEMQRLLEELESTAFEEAHPVLQASYAHYAFVVIHPFADGNGRVARAMASAYTYRAARVPLLVLAHQRDTYFDALATADAGNTEDFVAFTGAAIREALELVTETLKTAQAPQPEAVLDSFREMFVVQGELSHQQLDQMANQLVSTLGEIAREQIDSLSPPEGIAIVIGNVSGANQSRPPAGYRPVVTPGPRFVRFEFESPQPASARHRRSVDVFVANAADSPAAILLQLAGMPAEQLALRASDLQPQLSSAARQRVASYVRRLLGTGLNALREKAEKNLRQAGY